MKVALGGPAFGYLMAKITIFWLSHVFNDALVEITITLASTYITFYIGEGLLNVSGVLAVVTLGIELNSRRTSISPEVETFLHRYTHEAAHFSLKRGKWVVSGVVVLCYLPFALCIATFLISSIETLYMYYMDK